MYFFDNFVYLARGPEPKIARISIFGLGFGSSEKFPSDLPSSLSLFMNKKLQVLGGFGKPWNLFLFYFLVSNSFFCTSAALETSIIRHSFGKRFKRALVAPKGCHAVYQVLELLSLVCFVYMSCAGVIVWSSCSFQGWFVLPYLVLDENSCLCVGAAFESKMDTSSRLFGSYFKSKVRWGNDLIGIYSVFARQSTGIVSQQNNTIKCCFIRDSRRLVSGTPSQGHWIIQKELHVQHLLSWEGSSKEVLLQNGGAGLEFHFKSQDKNNL